MSAAPRPDLSICVAVYKEHDPPNLETLVDSIRRAVGGYDAELVVALNGIEAERVGVPSGAKVVDLGTNRGVPVAWNRAAAAASGECLVFVNDDVILGAGSLALLRETLRDERDAGVVGPVGTQWDVRAGKHLAYLPDGAGPAGSVRECDVLSGFLFATPRPVFEQVGGFDENLTPCSYEEVDYCTAVRLTLGLRCLEVAGVEFEHDFGISAESRWKRLRFDGRSERLGSISKRNHAYFVAKWAPRVRG